MSLRCCQSDTERSPIGGAARDPETGGRITGRVETYTLAEQLLALGVDGIFTNMPDVLRPSATCPATTT